MGRTCAYIISILVIIISTFSRLEGQDTLYIPLRINTGLEVTGPVSYFIDKNILSVEGYVTYDRNEKMAFAFNAGYLDYKFSQYNYTYLNNGFFAAAGIDLNILKPKKSLGKYWGGLSLRYGLTRFRWEVPELRQANYWGESSSSIPLTKNWGHFLEASPGMRAEIFRNFSMGWSISLRMLLYSGKSAEGIKPIYIPGFGNSEKRFSTGFSYYIVWSIPYKKIRVITKKEEPEEDEDTEDQTNPNGSRNNNSYNNSSNSRNQQQQNNTFR